MDSFHIQNVFFFYIDTITDNTLSLSQTMNKVLYAVLVIHVIIGVVGVTLSFISMENNKKDTKRNNTDG